MDQPITEEDSYADRRQLFKNIWDTAITIEKKEEEKKEQNIIHKPKVIKTLKLDEKGSKVKKKKQRIKKLKIVCNKLLYFGNRQDADDVIYKQVMTKGRKSPIRKAGTRTPKKSKVTKVRKGKKAKCMFTPIQGTSQTETTSPNRFAKLDKTSSNSSSIKIQGPSFNVQENFPKRENCNRLQKFPDPKILIRASHKYSNKRPFPINKIYIN